jgi:hypothetical protein
MSNIGGINNLRLVKISMPNLNNYYLRQLEPQKVKIFISVFVFYFSLLILFIIEQ